MCNQAVGLVSAALEREGIPTVCIQLLRLVAEAVRPPRSLLVPFPHGYPLGRANDVELQTRVLRAALDLLEAPGPGPLLVEFAEPRNPGQP